MINLFLICSKKNKKIMNNKAVYTLFYKESLKYLKTTHTYHLVDPSP